MKKMNNIFKLFTVFALFAVTACSSTGGVESSQEVSTPAVTVSNEAELSEAVRTALATKVFYFGFDSVELSVADRSTLVYHAVNLKGNTDMTIRLEGHASEEGTREYNIPLGERRAKAIANFLMANGVAGAQIEVVSYGEERPADTGTTEASRAKNRRVEIK
jgi:peptidoglycan-associated lipoprotein